MRPVQHMAGPSDGVFLQDFPAWRQRGHQVATRALARVCRWALDTLHVEGVTTRVHEDNAASRRVLQKAGFHLVGSETSPDADHLDLVFVLRRPAGVVG